MMKMERYLIQQEQQKRWHIIQSGEQLTMCADGRAPRTKQLASEEAAQQQLQKEVWSRLKKGWVLTCSEDEEANNHQPGTPIMHQHAGSGYGYTGFTPLVGSSKNNALYYSYTANQFERNLIMRVQPDGERTLVTELPGNTLIFELAADPVNNGLYLNRDHSIERWDMTLGQTSWQARRGYANVSVLDVSDSLLVYYTDNELLVRNQTEDAMIYRTEMFPEMVGGHSPQLRAAIHAPSGMLAYCSQTAEIVLVDLKSGKQRVLPKQQSAMTIKMAFSPDGSHLYVQEQQQGSYSLEVWEVATGESLEARKMTNIRTFALAMDKPLVAVQRYKQVLLLDTRTGQELLSFDLEHVVKNCQLAFTKDYLGVFTDYGCVSLYQI